MFCNAHHVSLSLTTFFTLRPGVSRNGRSCQCSGRCCCDCAGRTLGFVWCVQLSMHCGWSDEQLPGYRTLQLSPTWVSDLYTRLAGSKESSGAPSATTVLGFRPKNVTPEMVRLSSYCCVCNSLLVSGRNNTQHVPGHSKVSNCSTLMSPHDLVRHRKVLWRLQGRQ